MNFNDSDPISIKNYAEYLINTTFLNVIENADLDSDAKEEVITKVNNPRYKGGMGHLIEKYYFEYELNSDQEPDFPKAGVELKVTPYEFKKRGGYSAGERLVITMIDYKSAVEEVFLTSHVYSKSRLTLLIHYLRDRSLSKIDYPINYVTLFSPPEEDLKIIQQDYTKIISKVKEGRAHELSEGDTMYLGACTKGSTAAKSLVIQEYYAPYIKAPKRAFCFKQSYMTRVLNQYVLKKVNTYDSIIKDVKQLERQTFEQLIKNKINNHTEKTATELCEEFNVNPEAKNAFSTLAYRMLGVKSNQAEEFVKANIEVKAVRMKQDGSIKESISFPAFKFLDFAEEEWEESNFYNTVGAKKYLFVVYKFNGSDFVLKGCLLWNMPYDDLEEARIGWEAIQNRIHNGVTFTKKFNKNGTNFTIENNIPGISDHPIVHIRPHSNKRYYVLKTGEVIGDNPNDGDLLPDGQIMTQQCFWLNSSYIAKILSETFN